MNKAALIEALASKSNLTKKQAEEILENMLALITESLKKKEEVVLTGFGTFSAKIRHARKGVNPQKPNEKIDIPEVVIPKFKSGKALKDALKGK
jgi:DNA-binding protein HU-beta